MVNRVFVFQSGSLPPTKVIEILEMMGGKNPNHYTCDCEGYYYIDRDGNIDVSNKKPEGCKELLFDWELWGFYENKEIEAKIVHKCSTTDKTAHDIHVPSIIFDELNQMIDESPIFSRMNDSITAPDGYELVDANDNVVEGPVRMRKKRWRPKVGEKFYVVAVTLEEATFYRFYVYGCALGHEDQIKDSFSWFPDEISAQAFCDELNKAIEPIIQKRKEATK